MTITTTTLRDRLAELAPHLVVDVDDQGLFGGSLAAFSPCRRYRYVLTRQWNPEQPWCVFVLRNPSTATAAKNDPTVRRCIGFAESWGAGGLAVANLDAFISTDPTALGRVEDSTGPDNDLILREVPGLFGVDRVVAGWGTIGKPEARAAVVEDLFQAAGVDLLCLGTTDSGMPRHPLYVVGATQRVRWPGCLGHETRGGRR